MWIRPLLFGFLAFLGVASPADAVVEIDPSVKAKFRDWSRVESVLERSKRVRVEVLVWSAAYERLEFKKGAFATAEALSARAQRDVLVKAFGAEAYANGDLIKTIGLGTSRFRPAFTADLNVEGLERIGEQDAVLAMRIVEVLVPTGLDESIRITRTGSIWRKPHLATGHGRVVVNIDSGVERSHPFFSRRTQLGSRSAVIAEACFSTSGPSGEIPTCPNGTIEQFGTGAATPCADGHCSHGTATAGIAVGSNPIAKATPRAGYAPAADLIAVNATTRIPDRVEAAMFDNNVIDAWLWALRLKVEDGRSISAISGSHAKFPPHPGLDCDALYPDVVAIVNLLRANGIAVVTAAGNGERIEDAGVWGAMGFPACLTPVTSVAGSDAPNGSIAWFSNQSATTDFFMPGIQIDTSLTNGGWGWMTGTSAAVPQIAGLFADFQSRFPDAGPAEIESVLKGTGVRYRYWLNERWVEIRQPDALTAMERMTAWRRPPTIWVDPGAGTTTMERFSRGRIHNGRLDIRVGGVAGAVTRWRLSGLPDWLTASNPDNAFDPDPLSGRTGTGFERIRLVPNAAAAALAPGLHEATLEIANLDPRGAGSTRHTVQFRIWPAL